MTPNYPLTLEKTLLNNTELKDIPELLYFGKIKNSPWYKSLSEYRHSLTHRLSPACEGQESYNILLKTVSRFLKFKPIGYTIDQLDNCITDGHNNIVVTINQCEELLNKIPCRVCCGEDHAI